MRMRSRVAYLSGAARPHIRENFLAARKGLDRLDLIGSRADDGLTSHKGSSFLELESYASTAGGSF